MSNASAPANTNQYDYFGLQKPMVDKLGKSLHRLEELILGWAELITKLTPLS